MSPLNSLTFFCLHVHNLQIFLWFRLAESITLLKLDHGPLAAHKVIWQLPTFPNPIYNSLLFFSSSHFFLLYEYPVAQFFGLLLQLPPSRAARYYVSLGMCLASSTGGSAFTTFFFPRVAFRGHIWPFFVSAVLPPFSLSELFPLIPFSSISLGAPESTLCPLYFWEVGCRIRTPPCVTNFFSDPSDGPRGLRSRGKSVSWFIRASSSFSPVTGFRISGLWGLQGMVRIQYNNCKKKLKKEEKKKKARLGSRYNGLAVGTKFLPCLSVRFGLLMTLPFVRGWISPRAPDKIVPYL